MVITTEQVKKLRDATGISVMQCRKALEEAGGDPEKALFLLRKRGAEVAAKKSDRTLGAGVVAAYVHANGAVGAMVELACETDFVSKNPEFRALAYDIALHVAAMAPEFLSVDAVPKEAKAKAREAFASEVAGKSEELQEKILSGKLSSYFAERALLEQPFVKNPEQTIRGLVEGAVQKFGEKTAVVRFTRFAAGGK